MRTPSSPLELINDTHSVWSFELFRLQRLLLFLDVLLRSCVQSRWMLFFFFGLFVLDFRAPQAQAHPTELLQARILSLVLAEPS